MYAIPYPPMAEDPQLIIAQERRDRAMRDITISDLIATTEDLAAQIVNEQDHPLYALARYVLAHGTTQQTGRQPHVSEQVGAAYEKLMDLAIERLVDEALMNETAWEEER